MFSEQDSIENALQKKSGAIPGHVVLILEKQGEDTMPIILKLTKHEEISNLLSKKDD